MRSVDDIDALVEEGLEALDEGELDRVEAALTRLRKTGDEGAIAFLTGLLANARGDTAAALEHLGRAAEVMPEEPAPLIYAAEIQLYSGSDPAAALALCEQALDLIEEEADLVDAVLLAAEAHLVQGDGEAAATVLEELDGCSIDDPEVHYQAGQLLLQAGELDRAERAFRAALHLDEEYADAWHGLGCVLEEREDRPGMLDAWQRTRALDANEEPMPWAMAEGEFEQVAEAALAELPQEIIDRLANVPILIDARPSEELVAEGNDPRLLGLFTGVPLPHKSHVTEQGPHLDGIHLFQRNLERFCSDPEHLAQEIRITVIHETAHFFGLEDEDLEKLGLG